MLCCPALRLTGGCYGRAMTHPFELATAPESIAVRCPDCTGMAAWFAARSGIVEDKELRRRAAESQACDVDASVGWGNNRQTVVTYYPQLDVGDPMRELAERLPRTDGGRGTRLCAACGERARHELNWPDDAWFRCEVRGKTLWAWDRSYAADLREFIASAARDRHTHEHPLFLMHIPGHFLLAKHREAAVKKLQRLLEGAHPA